jgi:hypothetical protein
MTIKSHLIFEDEEEYYLTSRYELYPPRTATEELLRFEDIGSTAEEAKSEWVDRANGRDKVAHSVCDYDEFDTDITEIYVVDVENKILEHYKPQQGRLFDVRKLEDLRSELEPRQTFDLITGSLII